MKKIFCEGISDQIFIADFIEYHFDIIFRREEITKNKKIRIYSKDVEIVSIDGCSKIHTELYKQQLIENTETGGLNVIVFDADYKDMSNGNNGYESCCQKLDNLKEEISFEYFLWPDNENDGYLEDVQKTMIPNMKKPILDCMDNHFSCLDSLRNEHKIKEFGDKDIILIYLHYCQKENKPSAVRYNDEEFWNLCAEENEPLKRFKKFLIEKLNLNELTTYCSGV
jgi:hypothetical protein